MHRAVDFPGPVASVAKEIRNYGHARRPLGSSTRIEPAAVRYGAAHLPELSVYCEAKTIFPYERWARLTSPHRRAGPVV